MTPRALLGVATLVSGLLFAPFADITAQGAALELNLEATAVPGDSMTADPLPGGPLPNVDPWRDDEPGLLVRRSAGVAAESDPTRYQQWAYDLGGHTVSVGTLTIWVAPEGFDRTKTVSFRAFLLSCAGACEVLDSADATVQNAANWRRTSVPLMVAEQVLPEGSELVLKIVVLASSEAGAMFAYGTRAYSANLLVNDLGVTPTTTTSTTTTTAPTTTSTTTPTTSSTTTPTTTSTTTPTTTSTAASETTTSTTTSPTPTTTGSQPESSTATTSPQSPEAAPGARETERDSGPPEDEGAAVAGPVDGGPSAPPPAATETSQLQPWASLTGRTGANLSTMPMAIANVTAGSSGLHALSPTEGMSVAYATVAENIHLYWQPAVGLGILAALLLWIGLARREDSAKPAATS